MMIASLILASQSAARRTLLTNAGVAFTTTSAPLDEAQAKSRLLAEGLTPPAVAGALAEAKALSVSAEPTELVIGADQTLELDGRLFDKPSSVEEARVQLLALRGRSHRLHAAAAVAQGGRIVWSGLESVALHMRAFEPAFLDAYLSREGASILGCVGAYRLEGPGVQLFDAVEGDHFAVLGLPLLPLLGFLRSRGVGLR